MSSGIGAPHGRATRGTESEAGTRLWKPRDGSPRPRTAAVELAGRAAGARGGGRPRAENIAGPFADARTTRSGVRPGPRVGSGPDACASLTCDEGSLSEASDIAPRVIPVTSAALRLGLLAVPEPRVPAIGAGSVNRLPGTSGIARSHRRAIDGRRAEKKTAGLGCRSYSLGSGLSMLRARRPPRNANAKDSEYHQLMPLVLQTLGRLRCVRVALPIGRRRFFSRCRASSVSVVCCCFFSRHGNASETFFYVFR